MLETSRVSHRVMFLLLTVALSFNFVAADEITASVTEVREVKNVEEFDETCEVTGYTVRGTAWSTIRKGRTVIIGCITSSGVKIKLNETYTDHRAEFKCLTEGDGVILIPVACVLNGATFLIGSTYTYKGFFYECVQRSDLSIAVVPVGCRDSYGEMVFFGEEFRLGNFIFLCQPGEKPEIVGIKCFDSLMGIMHAIGERYPFGEYFYECQRKSKHSLKIAVVGCVGPFFSFVAPGERFVNGRAVIECYHDGDSLTQKVVGCYAKDHRNGLFSQYKLGDRFYETYKENFGYIMECAFEEGSIRHKPVECIYHDNEVDHYLEVGCAALLEKKVFICQRVSRKSVMIKLVTHPKRISLDDFLSENGLKKCETRTVYATAD